MYALRQLQSGMHKTRLAETLFSPYTTPVQDVMRSFALLSVPIPYSEIRATRSEHGASVGVPGSEEAQKESEAIREDGH